ncbi:Phage tail protein [Pseudomonas donghuensis]|uniref:phage tail assembly chaperone n=1 Tax=Pseudomonas donghuensis TaxID=1163398 RepID=UPI0039E069E5
MSAHVFSPGELSFYLVELRDHYEAAGTWPGDGVEITAERYAALLDEQAQGRVICADEDGLPMTKPRPALSADELAGIERSWRDAQLTETDSLVARHRDELEAGGTTLSAGQYQALQGYRKALRDWPGGNTFPLSEHRPVAPDWLPK